MEKIIWSREKYDEVFDKFVNSYPEIFSKNNPKPLKIGIREDIINDKKIDLSAEEINLFLGRYCNRIEYRNTIKAGGHRWNLRNVEDGVITAAQESASKIKAKTKLSIHDPNYQLKMRAGKRKK